ncbi:unnamed protein product [Prorocentrum cordatum]|uniref:Solute carrier family 40 protein n=1 Tax=Prorocentrum cordatum TaxID=2364126 RepID=A0ABN9PY92_9DINO|nr:unnamed protein product [Polarella glacialis]
MACLATPKELACVTLYVAAAHARESRWLERCGPLAGLLIFALSCALASWAPASQMAIEYGRGSGTLVGRLARLLGLAFGVVQACGLAWALRGPFSRQLHLRWLARWALGTRGGGRGTCST